MNKPHRIDALWPERLRGLEYIQIHPTFCGSENDLNVCFFFRLYIRNKISLLTFATKTFV